MRTAYPTGATRFVAVACKLIRVDSAVDLLFKPIETRRCRDVHARALDFSDFSVDSFERRRFAKPRKDIEIEIAARWIVTHRRVFAEQVRRGDFAYVLVVIIVIICLS